MNKETSEKIIDISNKDAADILRQMAASVTIPRGSSKSLIRYLNCLFALNKAIEVLENTPDKEVT